MTTALLDRKYAAKACVACRSKKRKCDKRLPACTRCTSVHQNCQYDDNKPHSKELPILGMNVDLKSNSRGPRQTISVSQTSTKSGLSCTKCRTGKRQCSRDLPACSRCVRTGIVCRYGGLPLANLAQASSLLLQPSDEFADLSEAHHALSPLSALIETNLPETLNSTSTGDSENFTTLKIASASSSQCHEHEQQFSVTRWTPSPLTIDHDSHRFLDPFHTYPSHLSRETITRTFHYSVQEMWPKLFPGMTYKGQSFIHEWMRSAMNCPPLFSAWLHSGAEHLLIRQRASGFQSPTLRKDTYELLLMRQEAITKLKEIVDENNPAIVTDQIIMAAFALALHPHERDQGATSRMKLAPLSNLQLLTRFTDIVIMDGHVRGLRHLVHERGGLDKIKMPGLTAGLSTWNLLTASKWLTRPFWPLRTSLQSDSAAEFLAKFENTQPGMGDLHFLLHSKFSRPVMWVFHALRGYSALLQEYADGRHFDLDLGYMLELRNLIHHHVLSLPPAILTGVGIASRTYDSFRLALAIYSLLVVFPVPLMTDPYPNAARLLRYELELVPEEEWTAMPTLLVWILMLGGIAALETPHRLWFVGRLHLQLEELGITSWKGFTHIMESLIWLDSPCGLEGLTLWNEVQHYGHQPLAECLPTTPGRLSPTIRAPWLNDEEVDPKTIIGRRCLHGAVYGFIQGCFRGSLKLRLIARQFVLSHDTLYPCLIQ